MGVLRKARTKSSALATARSLVLAPRITSTSAILSTGEKKCTPITCSGLRDAAAKPVMGRVDVLVAKMQLCATTASTRAITSALTLGSSNTASITRSQPAKAA